jgi:hypothetical protein
MPTYISLINWTEKGVAGFRDTVDRAEAGKELAAKFGGALKQIYWTVGPYDIVAITEATDDESGARSAEGTSPEVIALSTISRSWAASAAAPQASPRSRLA